MFRWSQKEIQVTHESKISFDTFTMVVVNQHHLPCSWFYKHALPVVAFGVRAGCVVFDSKFALVVSYAVADAWFTILEKAMTTLTYYKIRKKSDPKLFRLADGRWNTSGKVYDTLGKLRTAITLKMNSYYDTVREEVQDWEFVEYEVTVKEVKQLFDIVDKKKVWEMLKKWPLDYGYKKSGMNT